MAWIIFHILVGLLLVLRIHALVGVNFTITVSKNGTDNSSCWNGINIPCQTLEFAMKKSNLNNTRILLTEGDHHLSTSISLYYLHDFVIQGLGCMSTKNCSIAKTTLTCLRHNDTTGKSDSGLCFQRCSNLAFTNFEIRNCGATHPSTSRLSKKEPYKNMSTALHLRECHNVNINNVTVIRSNGMGVVMYDVGGVVEIAQTNFQNNTEQTASNFKEDIYSQSGFLLSGGGMYIEFTNTSLKNLFHMTDASNNIYIIKNCNFLQNTALHNKQKDLDTYSSFGLGGGMSIMLRGNATNNSFILDQCQFKDNNALWGAGLFMETHEHARGNSLYINDSTFVKNQATYGGGGVQIGMRSDGNNNVNFEWCKLNENEAQVGGGFGQYRESKKEIQNEMTTFKQCIIKSNVGVSGSAIRVVFTSLTLINTTVFGNKAKLHTFGKDHGAIYISIGSVLFRSHNIIRQNSHSGIVLESTSLVVYDKLDLINNTGSNGGAVAMYGMSYIVLKRNSTANFYNNSASKLGGALYFEAPGPYDIPMNTTTFIMRDYVCNLFFGERVAEEKQNVDPDTFPTHVNFVSNKAPKNSGSAVYGTSLDGCRIYNNSALRWKTFKYSQGEQPYIVTSAVTMNTQREEWQTFPGKSFSPKITLSDENDNNVFGTIKITIISQPGKPVKIMGASSHLFVVKDNKIGNIVLTGPVHSAFSVELETVNGFILQHKVQNLVLKPCPLGLYQPTNKMTCKCLSTFSKGLSNGVTHCSNNKPHVLKRRWGDPLHSSPDFASLTCPTHYCSQRCEGDDGIDCIYHKKTQCGKNRQWDAILCGKCKKEHSVQLGNEDCIANKDCKVSWGILLICAIFILLSILILIVLFLNVDTYSSYLNAFFYSYQIIPLFIRGNSQPDSFLSVVYGLVTWSGTGHLDVGVCIWRGMTDLSKLAFNYIFPTFLIVFTVGLCVCSNYRESSWLNTHTCSRAFAFISVVAYADFTQITFKLLHRVHVRSDKTVLYYAGEVEYFGQEHLPFAFVAIFVLIVVVILFPVLVMFPHYFTKLPGIIKLKGIFDAFQYCFKRKYVLFSGFYFISRLILLAISIFIQSGTLQHTLLLIVCILILVLFSTLKPYTTELMNYHDILLLTDVCIIAGLNAATGGVVEEDVRKALEKTTDGLAYVPLLCTLVHLLYWIVLKIRLRKVRKRKIQNEQTASRIPYRVQESEIRDYAPYIRYISDEER